MGSKERDNSAYSEVGAGGHSGTSTSGCSSGSCGTAGSGIDLGPLTHFFGGKGVATANAGSYTSSGLFAKGGSFASSKCWFVL